MLSTHRMSSTVLAVNSGMVLRDARTSRCAGSIPPPAVAEKEKKRRVPGAARIVADHLPHFSHKLSAMLGAGMPILAALKSLENQTNHESFRMVLSEVRRLVENGSSLS